VSSHVQHSRRRANAGNLVHDDEDLRNAQAESLDFNRGAKSGLERATKRLDDIRDWRWSFPNLADELDRAKLDGGLYLVEVTF
jgi:hypothetical protein